MAITPVNGIPPVTPTPSQEQAPPRLSPLQQGNVDGGRATVVDGKLVPTGRDNATGPDHASGPSPRVTYDAAGRHPGTDRGDGANRGDGPGPGVHGDRAGPVDRGANNSPPSDGSGPRSGGTTGTGSTTTTSGAGGYGPRPGGLDTGHTTIPTSQSAGTPATFSTGLDTGVLGSLGNTVNGVGATVRGLLAGTLGVSPGAGTTGLPGDDILPPLGSPLAALGSKVVAPVVATLDQVAGSLGNTVQTVVGGAASTAQPVVGGLTAQMGSGATAALSVARDAGGPLSLARGEGALGGATLEGTRGTTGASLAALGAAREGMLAGFGALALAAGERGLPGGIAPSAGRALAQEALLARMAGMFAPTGQGARGGEPGTWMGLAAALAARAAAGDAAAAATLARTATENGGEAAHLNTRQPDPLPAFAPNPALRTAEDPDDPTTGAIAGEAPAFSCRCDSRPPEIIFADGLEAAPRAGDVVAQADATPIALAAPLANAAALDIARRGGAEPVALRRIGGIDMTRTPEGEGALDIALATAAKTTVPRDEAAA